MKLNSFLILTLGLFLCACEDTLTNIGSSIRPDTDDLTVKTTNFELASRTFLADSIYVRTGTPLLGEVTDKTYGTVRVDYAAQLYAQPGFNFDVINSSDSVLYSMTNPKDSMVNNQLDSAVLYVYYQSYIGDSLTPMAVTAYQVQQQLPKNFYSNIDFTPYVTPLKPLGSAGYTGKDMTVSDSIRDMTDYVAAVRVKMIDEVKDSFLKAVRETPKVFDDQSTFEQFFPGIYLKNTYGDGTILQVARTSLYFYYRTYHNLKPGGDPLVGSDGKDSSYVVNRTKYLAVTPDVIQLNQVQNPVNQNPAILNNDSATFITSPGGYFTEIDIPVGKIMAELSSNTTATAEYLNGVLLNVSAYKPVDNIFSATPPSNMLLVERSKMNEFFEGNKLPDSEKSFMGSYASDSTAGTYGYNFNNINKLVIAFAEEAKKDGSYDESYVVKMAMVPISTTLDSYNYVSQIANYFLPGAVTLKGGTSPQKVQVNYTIQAND